MATPLHPTLNLATPAEHPRRFTAFPPPKHSWWSAIIVGVILGVAVLAVGNLLGGCGAKNMICPVIDLADEACPYVVAKLPDGTAVKMRKSELKALAVKMPRLDGDGGTP